MVQRIETPCQKLCALDADRMCTGCGRSVDEIVRWGRMTHEERRAIMDRLDETFTPAPPRA